jgi:hypothetical protein
MFRTVHNEPEIPCATFVAHRNSATDMLVIPIPLSVFPVSAVGVLLLVLVDLRCGAEVGIGHVPCRGMRERLREMAVGNLQFIDEVRQECNRSPAGKPEKPGKMG